MSPVTGMLTMYGDQLRFDRAVDSSCQPADIDETDDSMSCVRLDRHLINSVDISDNSPRPLPPHAQFVSQYYYYCYYY